MPSPRSSAPDPGVSAFPRQSLSPSYLGDYFVVFPDLAGAGIRHAVNYAPPLSRQGIEQQTLTPLSADETLCIRWLFRQAGLNVNDYRELTIYRRIPALLRTLHVRSLPELWMLLRAQPDLVPKAIDSLLIGVTSLFRDPEVFDALRRTALPELARSGQEINIWGAACSDGLELYSLAMLLFESALLHRARLLGTDCRASAIERARAATLTPDQVHHVDPGLVGRHLQLCDQSLRVSTLIQSRITWRQANLLHQAEPGAWDMILCRNFAIYLRAGAAYELWSRLHAALRPGGFLVTGTAERVLSTVGFRQVGPCLYRREE